MRTCRLLLSALSVVVVILFISACGGGSSTPPETPTATAPIGDLSGDWQISGTDTSSTAECDGVGFNVTASISQTGSKLSVTNFRASTLSGTMSGDKVTFTGSYAEDGGTTTITRSLLTVSADCNRFTGRDSWTWSGGGFSCSGTSTYTGTRLTGSGCDSVGGGGGGGGGTAALDTSFGTNGIVISDIGGIGFGRSLVVDDSDRIVLVGSTNLRGGNDFALLRYNTDGSPDTGFGTGGLVVTDLGGDDRGRAIVIDSRKRIIAGGDVLFTMSDFALARYQANGSLDTGFNGTGLLTTDFNNRPEPGIDILLDANGRIVVAGFAHNGTDYDFAVARYNPDGSLDTTFNTTGFVTTNLGADDRGGSVAVDNRGNIYVGGRTNLGTDTRFAIVSYRPDGSLNTTFASTGYKIIDLGGNDDGIKGLIVDASNRILVTGRTNRGGDRDLVVMRLNPDGSKDTSFADAGTYVLDIGGFTEQGASLAFDADGKIIVLGRTNYRGDADFLLLRLNSNGSLDTGFADAGMATIDMGGDERGRGLAIDSKGRIIIGGRSDQGRGFRFAVARILP